MEFKKIETKKKSTYAAEQIVEAIRRGDYQVGDKLPSEREIAEQMGVSRPSVREAISALQIVGILESRPGDGTYVVKALTDFEEEYSALLLLEQSESLSEAFEARRVLEESVIRLACEKAAPEDIEDVARVLEEMKQAAQEQNFEALMETNRRFHWAIAEATHNSLLLRALEPLLEVMRQRLPRELRGKYYREDAQKFEETYEMHQRIFDALAARHVTQAVQAMIRHFDILEKDLND